MFKIIKRARPPEVLELNKIALKYQRKIQNKIKSIFDIIRDNISINEISNLIKNLDIDSVTQIIDFSLAQKELDELKNTLLSGANEAGIFFNSTIFKKRIHKAKKRIPIITKPELIYDTKSQRLKKLLDIRWDQYMTDIEKETKIAIRTLIEKELSKGVPPMKLSKRILPLIGLHERYSIAVSRYHDILLEKGFPQDRAESNMLYYAEKLLVRRAEDIARTESSFVVNAGEREVIYQAIDKDLIESRKTKKIWIIDPATSCVNCEPLDREKRNLEDVFQSSLGSVDMPPLHPNCNCILDYEVEVK